MKKFLVALIACVIVLLSAPATAQEPEEQQGPAPVIRCEVSAISPLRSLIKCVDSAGTVVEEIVVEIEERIKEVRIPGPTITLPSKPTRTKTVTVPGPTSTITVPSSPRTIYVPGPVRTKTVRVPAPVLMETLVATVTATSTVTANPVTVSPKERPLDKSTARSVLFDPPPVTTTRAVGYSALALFSLIGLTLFGLWLGYILGWKDKERKEMKFLDALRDQFYYKGQHS